VAIIRDLFDRAVVERAIDRLRATRRVERSGYSHAATQARVAKGLGLLLPTSALLRLLPSYISTDQSEQHHDRNNESSHDRFSVKRNLPNGSIITGPASNNSQPACRFHR